MLIDLGLDLTSGDSSDGRHRDLQRSGRGNPNPVPRLLSSEAGWVPGEEKEGTVAELKSMESLIPIDTNTGSMVAIPEPTGSRSSARVRYRRYIWHGGARRGGFEVNASFPIGNTAGTNIPPSSVGFQIGLTNSRRSRHSSSTVDRFRAPLV
ncbi:hypothetical protein PM082_007563 [Marasmius tenuissimus]|nr:hypothetical protein PM082_007563 [Marasmius tenuissimus]